MAEIHDVLVEPLRQIPDERGAIFRMLREDDYKFERFGEIYFSVIYPGAIKGWHKHLRTTLNYAVPVGMIRLACYDDRDWSPTYKQVQEIFVGELNYARVTIPPGIWNGYCSLGGKSALVANCATYVHDPEEMERADPYGTTVPFDFSEMRY